MDDTFVRVKLEAAKRFKKGGHFYEAEKELREALEVAPADLKVRTALADVFYHLSRYHEAEKLINEVLSVKPDDTYAIYLAGLIAYKQQKFGRALQDFSAVLQIKPDHYYSQKMVVLLLLKQQKWDEAHAMINKAMMQNEDDPFLMNQLARVYRANGDYDKAIGILENLQKLNRDNEFVRKQLLELKALKANKSPDQISTEISALLNISSQKNRPELWQVRAENLRKAGKFAEAIDAYQGLLKLDPENSYARRQVAFIYKKMGDAEKAEEFLTPLFLENPSDMYVRNTLFSIFKEHFGLWQWIKLLQEALVRHPDQVNLHGMIKKYRSQLDSLRGFDWTSEKFEEELAGIEHQNYSYNLRQDSFLPLHRFLLRYLKSIKEIPGLTELIEKAKKDQRVARTLHKTANGGEIRPFYQSWLFWIHFYVLSKQKSGIEEVLYRPAAHDDGGPVTWIVRKKEYYLNIHDYSDRAVKKVVRRGKGWTIRIPVDLPGTGQAGAWPLASPSDIVKILSWLD